MDIRLYLRVIWRFRFLVLAGLVLALAVAFLGMFRVSSHGVSYRQQKTYGATEILQLKPQGPLAGFDPSVNLALLAQIYTTIATTDAVRSQFSEGRLVGTYSAVQVQTPTGPIPVIQVSGLAPTPQGATAIANDASEALKAYVAHDQVSASRSQKVFLKTLTNPEKPIVVRGRRLTLSIVLFLSVLIATLGLAFILENLRRRPPAPPVHELEPVLAGDGQNTPRRGTEGIQNGGVLDDAPAQPSVLGRSE
jgi:hypothetical protein